MTQVRHRVLGTLQAGEGSRAALGLQIGPDGVPRPVVLVLAPSEVNTDAEAAKALARETERAVILEHPHILRVLGLTQVDDGDRKALARVTEFADGESLRKVLEVAKKLPANYAALIVADLAMGVHYAHVAGNDDGTPLVHGDLRPETVMICFSGVSKASGYGALSVAPRELNGRRVVNRRKYSAPEQVVSGRAAVIVQSDVYLLGLMLHECLSGRSPFEGAEDHDQAILTRPLEVLPEEVPEPLAKIIQRATAKKSNERYPTPLAMREAIIEAMGALPSHEELAAWLGPLFPDLEGIRAQRKHLIDAGIASYAKEQWARAATDPETPVAAPPVPAPAAAAPRPAPPPRPPPAPRADPAPRPEPVRREPRIEDVETDVAASRYDTHSEFAAVGQQKKNPFVATIVVGLGTAALAIGAFVFLQRGAPPPVEPTPVATELEAAADASVQLAAVVDAGAVEAAPVAPPEPEVQSATLEIKVDPPVSISLNGKDQGRAPLKMNVEPGRYVVGLTDKNRGIRTSRTVVVSASGASESIYLQRGFVSVSAPDGSTIYIDGRKVGTAPLKEISVYEGSHRILVTVGKARWTQAFSVSANERMVFDVELNEP